MVESVGCCSALKNAHSARTQAALGAGRDSQPLLFLLSPKKDRLLQPAPSLTRQPGSIPSTPRQLEAIPFGETRQRRHGKTAVFISADPSLAERPHSLRCLPP